VPVPADIRTRDPNAREFSAQNLWRMRQFYETWSGEKKLSPLARELDWSNNLLILGKRKRSEEREFYLRLPLGCQTLSSLRRSKRSVTILNCHEFHFFRLFVVLIGGRPSCLGTGGINGDVALRAGWLSVFGRVDASTGRRKRSGRQKEANWAIPMSWQEQMQKSQSWNCGYELSSRLTNTPSGFVIRRGHCTASFRSSRLLPSPLISTVDYRNEAMGGGS